MNGEEIEVRLPDPNSKELTETEKMDLVVFSSTPTSKTIYKLFEIVIAVARNEAEDTPPDKKEEREARWTTLYAMKKFRNDVKSMIELATTEHLNDVRQKALEEDLKDEEKLQEIIASNFQR